MKKARGERQKALRKEVGNRQRGRRRKRKQMICKVRHRRQIESRRQGMKNTEKETEKNRI